MPKRNSDFDVDALPVETAKPRNTEHVVAPNMAPADAAKTLRSALTFIRNQGVVLESAKGHEPSIAEWVVGAPISGGWWGHAKGHEIHELTQQMRDAKELLVCTLAKGRITYIHKRLWPAFVKLADRFPRGTLNSVREVHTSSGRPIDSPAALETP